MPILAISLLLPNTPLSFLASQTSTLLSEIFSGFSRKQRKNHATNSIYFLQVYHFPYCFLATKHSFSASKSIKTQMKKKSLTTKAFEPKAKRSKEMKNLSCIIFSNLQLCTLGLSLGFSFSIWQQWQWMKQKCIKATTTCTFCSIGIEKDDEGALLACVHAEYINDCDEIHHNQRAILRFKRLGLKTTWTSNNPLFRIGWCCSRASCTRLERGMPGVPFSHQFFFI